MSESALIARNCVTRWSALNAHPFWAVRPVLVARDGLLFLTDAIYISQFPQPDYEPALQKPTTIGLPHVSESR